MNDFYYIILIWLSRPHMFGFILYCCANYIYVKLIWIFLFFFFFFFYKIRPIHIENYTYSFLIGITHIITEQTSHDDLNRNINPVGNYIYVFTYFNMVPLQYLKDAVGKIISSYKITCFMPPHRPRKSRCCNITTSTHTAITQW